MDCVCIAEVCLGGAAMIRPPDGMNAYMFAVLAGLRAAQLMRGCLPKVEPSTHKDTVVAQLEVAGGQCCAVVASPSPASSGDS